MISSSDVPACPACGSREVHPVTQADGPTLYACRRCGRDQTDAWASIQPKPEPAPVIGDTVPHGTPEPDPSKSSEAVDQETIFEAAIRLGIAATLTPERLQ